MGDVLMDKAPALYLEFVIERLAHQVVRKPIPPGRPGHDEEQAGVDGRFDVLPDGLAVHVRHGPEDLEAEFRPDDGRDGQNLDDRRIELADASTDHDANAGRDDDPQRVRVVLRVELSI
jgi:hypothetical protein